MGGDTPTPQQPAGPHSDSHSNERAVTCKEEEEKGPRTHEDDGDMEDDYSDGASESEDEYADSGYRYRVDRSSSEEEEEDEELTDGGGGGGGDTDDDDDDVGYGQHAYDREHEYGDGAVDGALLSGADPSVRACRLDRSLALTAAAAGGALHHADGKPDGCADPMQVDACGSTIAPHVSSPPVWLTGDLSHPADSLCRYLPAALAHAYKEEMNIQHLYTWQAECMMKDNAKPLRGGNLVYSAPTSGGKTLVAEILLFRYLLKYNLYRSHCPQLRSGFSPSVFRCLFIVPFNALVEEKSRDLTRLVDSLYGRLQRDHNGNQPDTSDIMPDTDAPKIHVKPIEHANDLAADSHVLIGVVTIEKAAMIIQQMMTEKRAQEIGCVVIDECHMLGDRHRGFLLEHAITKLRVAEHQRNKTSINEQQTTEEEKQHNYLPPLQVIALSATLPNIDQLCRCLDATFYATTFRPIDLSERYAIQAPLGGDNDRIALFLHDGKVDGRKVARYHPTLFPLMRQSTHPAFDPTMVGYLCYETMAANKNAIVFTSSKAQCVKYARDIARIVHAMQVAVANANGVPLVDQDEMMQKRAQLLAELKQAAIVDNMLKLTVPFGVAFHHAGLTFSERDIVESGYRSGAIAILCATTTLACGVNIGAARVLFTSMKVGRDQMDAATYRQCAGRAGRKGKDEHGESIIIGGADSYAFGRPIDWSRHHTDCRRLIQSDLPPLVSCIDQTEEAMVVSDNSGTRGTNTETGQYYPYLCRLILDSICSGIASSREDIDFLCGFTLMAQQKPREYIDGLTRVSIDWLVSHEFLFESPNLGRLSSSLRPPHSAPSVALLRSSPLATATAATAIPPNDALIAHTHLSHARQQIIIEGGLHILFLMTPIRVNFDIDFTLFAEVDSHQS